VVVVICPTCGASNSAFNVSCASCGAPLDDAPSAPPVHESPPADRWVGRTVSHYQIIARLADGGMGVVYRAIDTRLHRQVALKFPSPLLGHDPHARARFLREARAASALDHPNIGTIHEIAEHDGSAFIVMALYEGETLRDRIRRGALSIAQTQQILGELIAGLEAAHAAGIVHRDVKPSNVILTGGPLKLVDFGLAKPLVAGSSDTLSAPGELVGTVAYMAPEQLEGGRVDRAADIWAVGVVAYEMLAGEPPFTGPAHLLPTRILHDEPAPLRSRRPDVPARLDALVHAALQKSPSKRPPSMAALGEVMAHPAPPRMSGRRWRPGAQVLVALGLVCAALIAIVMYGVTSDPAVPGSTARRSVAVFGLHNASQRDDAAWLGGALAEMLRTELAAGDKLRVIPGENVVRMRRELSLADAGSYAPDTLGRIRRNLGADIVVAGSYLAIGEGKRIRLDLRVQDAAHGDTLASVAEAAGEADLFDLVARSGAQLRRQLGVAALTTSEVETLRHAEPSRPEAMRLYSAGLERLRQSDALGGRDLLAQATAAEPDFPLAHAALSEAWTALGNDARARDEARLAFDLSTGLPRTERISIEARHYEARHEWDQAIDRWRALFRFFPDDLEVGLKLAGAQIAGGRSKDAFQTLDELKKLIPPAGEDPRVWLAEASAAEAISDFDREQAAAQQAVQRAEAQGARLLVAHARLHAAWARGNQREAEQALRDLEAVRKMFEQVGDRAMVARIVDRAGTLAYYQGDIAASRRFFEEGLRLVRDLGFRNGEGAAAVHLANVVSDQGDNDRAKQLYQQALAISDETGDKHMRAAALNSYAGVLSDPRPAQAAYEEAAELFRELGDQRRLAVTLGNLASIRFGDGDMSGARTLREEALALARKIGDDRTATYALQGLASVLRVQGELAAGRARLEEGVAAATRAGDAVLAARMRIELASVLVDLDQHEAADAAISPAIEVLHAHKLGAFEAAGRNQQARALLVEDRRAEAQAAVEAGVAALAGEDGETAWALALTAARVRGASGRAADRAAAVKLLDDTLVKAKAGHATIGTLLSLRLRRAAVADGSERQRLLAAVQKEAALLGYAATAREAATLREHR
jgi:tetratricopeptide (TPR) repeat protein